MFPKYNMKSHFLFFFIQEREGGMDRGSTRWMNLKNITLGGKKASCRKIYWIYHFYKVFNMQTDNLYWLYMEHIAMINPNSEHWFPMGWWGRAAKAWRMDTHRTSTLLVMLLKQCDDYMGAMSFLNLFWITRLFHLKKSSSEIHWALGIQAWYRLRSLGFGIRVSDLSPTSFIY